MNGTCSCSVYIRQVPRSKMIGEKEMYGRVYYVATCCKVLLYLACWAFGFHAVKGQEISIRGKVLDANTQKPLTQVQIKNEAAVKQVLSNTKGLFEIVTSGFGELTLLFEKKGYKDLRIPIEIGQERVLELETVFMEELFVFDDKDVLVALSADDLYDEEVQSENVGVLQSNQDIFLKKAAFEFSQAFFKVRGYDSREGQVLFNGIPMNKSYDGRPQWNNWGGLNDVLRNQFFILGPGCSESSFGSPLGVLEINLSPVNTRPGLRLTSSISNRSYTGRLMATYSTGDSHKDLSYTLSASRRWADEGYLQGTLYDAISLFGTLELKVDKKSKMALTAIWAKNRRGRASAITQEVFELGGKAYNPYWGLQEGDIRNSRERLIEEPIVMINFLRDSESLRLRTGLAYHSGVRSKTRLGYQDAPNPDPSYYRYLPSYHINSPIGANFDNAAKAEEGFKHNSQLNWHGLYTVNANSPVAGKALYVHYADVTKDNYFIANATGNLNINNSFFIDVGGNYRLLDSRNFAEIKDLLGASYYLDEDGFSGTRNDLEGVYEKQSGIINYHYDLNHRFWEGFFQLRIQKAKWESFIAARFQEQKSWREGRFKNERYPGNSKGLSTPISNTSWSFKAGLNYVLSGRQQLQFNGLIESRPPLLKNHFINPREHNGLVENLLSPKISTLETNYVFRFPDVTGRLSGFYTRYQNDTDINFFYTDSGYGSDFVQEVITELDKLHMGFELGVDISLSSAFRLTIAGTISKYLYASDPNVTIYFDPTNEIEPINELGMVNLGIARIKDMRIAQGPQEAISIGIGYRDPKYWFTNLSLNYLNKSHIDINALQRTKSFSFSPGSNLPSVNYEPITARKLLKQSPLDKLYLLNLVGGKSWLLGKKYISIFISINNLFDVIYKTGGYEQGRNGHYEQLLKDIQTKHPRFGPKYWYGYGRTYFLNMSLSL